MAIDETARDASRSRERLPDWARVSLVSRDALLCLSCAIQGARGGTPVPPHPSHPDGTLVVPLSDLAAEPGGNPMIAAIVGCVERTEDRLRLLLETVVRPAARTFRLVLDRYAARPPAVESLGIEVSFDLAPTGRIVVRPSDSAYDDRRSPAELLDRLRHVLLNLGQLWADTGSRPRRARAVREAIENAFDAELRFLGPATRTALAGHRSAHGIPDGQDHQLRGVLDLIAQEARAQRAARDRPLAVLIDVDRCMRGDVVVPGLARFVAEVETARGRVVFLTRHREPRRRTDVVLAAAGLSRSRVEAVDRTLPEHERFAAYARTMRGSLRIAAVIGSPALDRRALAEQLPDAVSLVLADPTGESLPTPADHVLASLETQAQCGLTAKPGAAPALSGARSPAALRLGDLSWRQSSLDHAVQLTEEESRRIVAGLVAEAEKAGEQVAATARRTAIGAGTVELVHHLLTRKQFLKGPRGNFPLSRAQEALAPYVAEGQPIPVVSIGFPTKVHGHGLKALGSLPDLAELGALVRFRELQRAVSEVHPPGLRLVILTDGRHFRSRPDRAIQPYQAKLREFRDLIDPGLVELVDLDVAVGDRLGPAGVRGHRERVEHHRRRLHEALEGIDVTAAPHEALRQAEEICAGLDADDAAPPFSDLFGSLVYSVPVPAPRRTPTGEWARAVFADLFSTAGPSPLVLARARVLRNAWVTTTRYLAVVLADAGMSYDGSGLFRHRVKLTVHPRAGSLGFNYLGGIGVLPWHGTAAVDEHGQLSTDFAVSLLDRGFVPAYSPLLGPGQPWFMLPVTKVDPTASGARVAPDLFDTIRLRKH